MAQKDQSVKVWYLGGLGEVSDRPIVVNVKGKTIAVPGVGETLTLPRWLAVSLINKTRVQRSDGSSFFTFTNDPRLANRVAKGRSESSYSPEDVEELHALLEDLKTERAEIEAARAELAALKAALPPSKSALESETSAEEISEPLLPEAQTEEGEDALDESEEVESEEDSDEGESDDKPAPKRGRPKKNEDK